MTGIRAPFFVFEGGDGSGKSTQIARATRYLASAGVDVVVTREPGGCPSAEVIRTLLVEGDVDKWTVMSEALLVFAARAEHLARKINPCRAAGTVVLSDRFSDSTRAYQGIAGGIGLEAVETLNSLVVGDDGPDLTIVLDLPVEEGLKRVGARAGHETRFEDKGRAFLQIVRDAFLQVARDNPETHVVIDASGTAEAVEQQVIAAMRPLIERWQATQ